MKDYFIKIASIVLSLSILFFLIFLSVNSWNDFLAVCSSTDVLSWDANLRYLTSLDIFYNIRELNIVKAASIFLDSPTWPPFRTVLTLLTIVFSGEPSTVLDTSISMLFFILLLPSILYILYRLNRNNLSLIPFLLIISSAVLIFTFEIKVYSLSSMLETQGMFFLLWSVYFAHSIQNSIMKESAVQKYDLTGFSVSFIGLFFTKYPYGLMFIFAAVIYEIITNYSGLINLVKYSFKNHLKWFRIIYLSIFAALFIAVKIIAPDGGQTLFRKVIYISSLILFIDFNVLYYRNYKEINKYFSRAFSAMYLYGFLPAMIWLLIHMDRFNSILDTQSHVQDSQRSYAFSFINELFLLKIIPAIFIIFLILWILQHLWDYKKNRKMNFLTDPYFLSLVLLLGQIFVMEILTGNKQLRHIYHLLPALFVFQASAVMFRISYSRFAEKYKFEFSLAVLFFAAGLFFLMYKKINDPAIKENIPLCFTGNDKNIFDSPRYFASKIPSHKKYLLYNNFHMEQYPLHGYAISTDFDILLYKKVFYDGFISRYSKRSKYDMSRYDSVILISRDCSLPPKFTEFLEIYKLSSIPVQSWTHSSTNFCMSEFPVK